MKVERIVPWMAGALALAGAAASLLPSGKVRGYDLAAFGHVPVLEGGRVKPIDSLARNSLLMIRGQQSFRYQGRTIGPDEWLLDVMLRPEVANQEPVFVINDPDVLGLIGVPQSTNRYYPFATLLPHVDEIQKQAAAAEPVETKQRTRFQSAVLNLFERAQLYWRLENTIQLANGPSLAAEIVNASNPKWAPQQEALAEWGFFRALPPSAGSTGDGGWRTVGAALRDAAAGRVDPGLVPWAKIGLAYAAEDPASFDRAVDELHALSAAARPAVASQTHHEWLFNRAQPFYAGMVIYVLALLALFASWAWRPRLLQPAAFALLVAGMAVHTAGLLSRVVLQGRPPVTNLYSSAVFVGWGAVVLGVVLEWIYRKGFGTAVAAAAGFASLIVAHHLTGDGDTMEMMRAVLDSNFWLATHVVTITIGYSGTFLAGALAIGWTFREHLARRIEPATSEAIVSMTYGIICFALFFSFLGTVLGGIWADQSWGRFWGWDPKENGALLIVLWNAIILHARWGRYVRERGIMAMAIFGNVITSLSWFGVNMLGVGLHSYGFMDKAFWALSIFIGSQLALMALALAPRRFWAARQAVADEAAGPRGQASKPI